MARWKTKKRFHELSNASKGDYIDPSGEKFFWDKGGMFLVNKAGTKIVEPLDPRDVMEEINAK